MRLWRNRCLGMRITLTGKKGHNLWGLLPKGRKSQGLAPLSRPGTWLKLFPSERLLRKEHPTAWKLGSYLTQISIQSSVLWFVCACGRHSFIRVRPPQIPQFGLENWKTMWFPGQKSPTIPIKGSLHCGQS